MRSFLKPAWIAIALLAILFMVMTVQACTPAPLLKATAAGAITGGSAGLSHPHAGETCTREAMTQCEYACMMPGGILDLYCYEDCIYSIC